MKPAPFDYHRPATVAAMLDLLARHGDDGKVLAGGQSLVPAMNFRLARPSVLLDANELRELDFIAADGAHLRIGAMTRHAAFHRPVTDAPVGRLLAEVVRHIAHYPIRQRGTFGGSLAHADPASEWCLVATALDARMTIRSSAGDRAVDAGDFFRGTFTTALESQDLLTEIRLPVLEGWNAGFYEVARRAGDFALAMALAALRVDAGRIAEARLAVGGVASTAVRLAALEGELVGKAPGEAVFREIGAAAREAIEPSEDIHASAEYRRDLIATVVARALARAAA